MIVETAQLPELAGLVTMVDGGFDPIHEGHVRYFAAAVMLGLPVLCNVSPDSWVETKHTPILSQERRIEVIDAFRDITYTHLSGSSTVDVLRTLQPRYYAKGADWRGRLPQAEQRVCEQAGVDVVYLDTLTNSSSRLIEDFLKRQRASA